MKRSPVIATVFIAIIILFCLGIYYIFFLQPPAVMVPDPIRIGAPALEQNTLIYVAMEQGFFEKNGLNVTLADDYPTGVGPVSDMAEGKLDMSVSADTRSLPGYFTRSNVSIIAILDKYQNEELLTRKDSGVRNISDLKGRKIGLPRGTILEFFLGRFLELNGISIGDVVLVNVNTSQSVAAITEGEVDAIMYFQPYTTRIRDRLGDNVTGWPAQSNQLLYGVVTARDDWIVSHPGQVERFLRSLEEAREFSLAHPEETKAIVKKRLNLTDSYLEATWPDHQFTLSLDQSLLIAMNEEARWMIENNMTSSEVLPDFRNSISVQGLLAVNPPAVNIR